MCGIAGIISPGKNSTLIINRMCQSLRHRGKDDQGFFIDEDKGVYLGNNRLSIIDLSSRAKQPFYNEDNTVLTVVNGEIYNFVDLKNDLIKNGHQFRSDSDSEVTVHAYEEWGEDFVHRLKGMFSICVWDSRKNKLILIRDPIGIKPLYYFKDDNILAFSSEIKAFLKLSSDVYTPRINFKAIERLLMFPFIPDDDITALEGIHKLAPGHMLILENNEIAIKKYWELEFNPEAAKMPFTDACDLLENKMFEVIKSHLQSDVKIGIFLSGGVDSGFVAAVASIMANEPLYTFTIGYRHPFDERAYAQRVASHIHSFHTSFLVEPLEVGKRMEEIIWSFDDLSSTDGGLIANYLLAEKAKESNIKVVLNGEGADEIFGGYPWFTLSSFPLRILPQHLRDFLFYCRISKRFSDFKTFEGAGLLGDLIKTFHEKDVFRQISKFEIRYQLPNNFLMKVDKGTMAHGVETRVPYLDKDVVEFAYNLPTQFKRNIRISGSKKICDKAILRRVASKYLPQDIVYRKKRGFLLPISDILKSNMDKVREYLLSRDSISQELFPRKKLEKLFKYERCLTLPLRKEREALLWKLFIMEVWKAIVLK